MTAFAEVTSILNGRLLSKISTDADELEPLTAKPFFAATHPHIHIFDTMKKVRLLVIRHFKLDFLSDGSMVLGTRLICKLVVVKQQISVLVSGIKPSIWNIIF